MVTISSSAYEYIIPPLAVLNEYDIVESVKENVVFVLLSRLTNPPVPPFA